MFRKIFLFLIMIGSLTKLYSQTEITGAGATFPYPLYSKMFDEYYKIYAVKNGIIIFASVDAHSEKDPEFLNFPPHCIKGKRGYEKIDETRAEKFISVPYDREISFEIKDYNQIIFEKKTFSIFDNPNFIKILKKLGKEIFFVYGVTTEYCVKEAADGLIGQNYRVYLIVDAIKAIDKEKGEKVIEELKLKGVKLIKTEEVFKIIEKEG